MMAAMDESQYAQVLFNIGKDVFLTHTDVECTVEVTKSLEPSKWDWVGLYNVGFKKTSEYITFHYFPIPADYKKGQSVQVRMVFSAQHLPKENGYYQLCYVSYEKRMICGASNPIQITDVSTKDFVEKEEGDMMIIRSRADVMQEEIQGLNHRMLLLAQKCETFQEEIRQGEETLKMRDGLISALQREIQAQEAELTVASDKTVELERKLEAAVRQEHSLQEERIQMRKDLACQELHVKGLIGEIDELKLNVRTLESEKDELSGLKQSLEDEVNTYKDQVMESQTKLTQSGKTIAKLNENLEVAYNQSALLVEECEELKKREAEHVECLRQLDVTLGQMKQQKTDAERKRDDLTHELQNANDKLLACDTMKVKMSRDLEAYEQTQQKMSNKFENQESELRHMREQLQQKSKECVDMKEQLAVKHNQLTEQEKCTAKKTHNMMQAEATLNQALQEIESRTASQLETDKKRQAAEKELNMTLKQLDMVKVQLKAVSEEKQTLQRQVKEFEDELTNTLVLKDQEVMDMAQQLKETQRLLEEKEAELSTMRQLIEDLTGRMTASDEKAAEQSSLAMEKSKCLMVAEAELENTAEMLDEYRRQLESVAEEKEKLIQLCSEKADTLSKMEDEKVTAAKEAEGVSFCLQTANEALKVRLEFKNSEMVELQKNKEELQDLLKKHKEELQVYEQEVQQLTQRLELGKIEYTSKARENQKLMNELQKHNVQYVRSSSRSSSSDVQSASSPDKGASSASDSEGESPKEKKYKRLYKSTKKEVELMKITLEEKEKEVNTLRQVISTSETTIQEKNSDIQHLEALLRDMQEDGDPGQEEEAALERPAFHDNLAFEGAETTKVPNSILEASASEGQELPVPLEPTVVSVATVESSIDGEEPQAEEGSQDVFEDCPQVLPPEESFMDAIGEEMKICPICHKSNFAPDDFDEHLATHFGRVCPVCRHQADDTMSSEDFEQHVNRCLDSESAASSS